MTQAAPPSVAVPRIATRLSHVDPQTGRFSIRGRDGCELAASSRYEDAAALLWGDLVPGGCRQSELGEMRVRAFSQLLALQPHLSGLSVTDRVRFLVSSLPDSALHSESVPALATIGAAAAFSVQSDAPGGLLPPDPSLPHAADLLRMLTGRMPSVAACRAFEAYLVGMIDHGLNASTFTVRIVASTRAGTLPSIVAALCALAGPLHGGAPSLVTDMLDDAAGSPALEAYVATTLAAGRRFPGFGSRAYRGRDPRADLFLGLAENVSSDPKRLQLARSLEGLVLAATGTRPKPVFTNVEYYAAVLLEALGIPRSAFTAVFASARTAGWIAHVREQVREGRLIRPS